MSKWLIVVLIVVGIPFVFLYSLLSGSGSSGSPVVVIVAFLGALPILAGWIGAIARSAQLGHWVWFAIALVIGPLGGLAYGLFGPSQTAAPQPAPATGMGWAPPPPGYQQPGQPHAMMPDYQQPRYPPAGYPPSGNPPPGQPPAPGGSGWGQRY